MSSAKSVSPPLQSGRRSHARRKLEGLVYVDFGPDNGALLNDLGEGGLSFQSVVPVGKDQALLLKFKLPGDSHHIEGYAEVAWLNESGKSGGLRFVELSADAYAQIRGWTGVLSAPDAGAPEAEKQTSSNPAQESMPEGAPANSMEESTSLSPATNEAPPADEPADEQVPAGQSEPPDASLVPEFAVEATTAADSTEPLATQVELAPAGTPFISATSTGDIGASESALPPESEHMVEDAPEPAESSVELAEFQGSSESGRAGSPPSNDSSDRGFGVPKKTAAPKPTAALHPSPEIKPRMQSAPASEVPVSHAGVTRTPELTSGSSTLAPATPARAVRVPAPDSRNDSRNLVPVQKRQRRAAPSKPESPLPPADRLDSGVRGSFLRQSPKPVPASTEWENLLPGQEEELKPQATLASQALKLGIGAAAGACLVLALIAGVPALRARVQATANARLVGSNPANAPAFQVEVADLNNRRWILGSGGEAGSPFSDTPSRRGRQPEASSAPRNESVKSSRSGDSEDSNDTVNTPQPKLPRPGELALSRPHETQAQAPSAQLVAPSIFDGITPPIGSVSDRLADGGPEAPGIVQPESQPSTHASALQAAILLQRVAPVYPKAASEAHLTGEVRINATIGRDGVPRELKVISGDPRLVDAARAAISQWRYRPATLGAQPIETQIVVSVAFELK